MQKTASVTRCLAVRRSLLRLVKPGTAPAATLLALAAASFAPGAAQAQVIVRDLQPVSMDFRAAAQDSIRAHQAQVRARQVRVRQSKSQADLPRFTNNLTMSGDQRSIPLQLRNKPAPAPTVPGLKRIAPSSVGVINSFIRGDLYTDGDNDTASSLTTTDLTVGSDYRVSEDFMFGMAAGSLHTGDATGSTVSAYMTMQPLQRIFVDMSLSYGVHQSHGGEVAATGVGSLEGTSHGFTMTLNNPRQIGEWYWSPYSRYDRIQTDLDTGLTSGTAPMSYGLSAVSLGSTAATTWTTPFGAVRPMVLVEVQREIITVAGVGTTSSMTQGVVGFGMTTKVSRDMSAFAESRYHSDLAATLDRQMMLGVKFGF